MTDYYSIWENPGSDYIGSDTSAWGTLYEPVSTIGYVNTAGDQDWYNITLYAGSTYHITLTGADGFDPVVRLLDSNGSQLAYNDDSGGTRNSLITYTPTTTGTYFISAQGYSTSTGGYSLSLGGPSVAFPTIYNADGTFTLDGSADSSGLGISLIADMNVIGGAGDDTVWSYYFNMRSYNIAPSSCIVDGNAGTDTFLAGYYEDEFYVQAGSTASHLTIVTPHGTDTLLNVERVVLGSGWAYETASLVPSAPTFELAAFAPSAGGWGSDDTYPRTLGDVNGDGLDDIVGFGNAGAYVSLATGNGHFAAPTFELAAFAPGAGGWGSDDTYPRVLGDVNRDGQADIVGFGNAGVYVSLATSSGHFAAPTFELAAFAPSAGGWGSDDTYPRMLGDVNGDEYDDIVGFGGAGVYVSLATGYGHFANPTFELAAFAPGAGGWSSDDTYPRMLGDVNGDGRDDIVGFGGAGVYVSLATGNGHFANPTFELATFAPGAGGWSSDDTYPRMLGDVNGDGRDDIVGFGGTGTYISLATGDGHFAARRFDLDAFAPGAGGWSSDDAFPRMLADISGDGRDDIVGFGNAGVYSYLMV